MSCARVWMWLWSWSIVRLVLSSTDKSPPNTRHDCARRQLLGAAKAINTLSVRVTFTCALAFLLFTKISPSFRRLSSSGDSSGTTVLIQSANLPLLCWSHGGNVGRRGRRSRCQSWRRSRRWRSGVFARRHQNLRRALHDRIHAPDALQPHAALVFHHFPGEHMVERVPVRVKNRVGASCRSPVPCRF